MTERKEREKTLKGKPFEPGNPGRPKGTPNKFTTLKQAFIEAFLDERVGGTEGLVAWILSSNRNREKFYQMVTKLFPQEVGFTADDAEKFTNKLILEVVHVKGADLADGDGGNGGDPVK